MMAPVKAAAVSDESADSYVELLRISANVDGSGRIVFTKNSMRYEHKYWSPPANVKVNGEPWTDLNHTPSSWGDFSRKLDLSRAWIAKRQGRDVAVLEHTANGFDLYLCDSPNGAADYDVTIAIPR